MDWAKTTARRDQIQLDFNYVWCILYWRFYCTLIFPETNSGQQGLTYQRKHHMDLSDCFFLYHYFIDPIIMIDFLLIIKISGYKLT